ncbi:MAG: hypothetical protein HKN00_07365 [Flavobacteriaceae bacterium]|nr:hypothetical protein [Bacteroidia bacterium]NNF74985.1 hypothetical protein [Flavobacteriaceae bacterium]
MSTAVYIAIFMVVFFSSIYFWAYHYSEYKDKRKWLEKERKEEEKELKFQKLKENAKVRRDEIDERYRQQNERSKRIQKELEKLEDIKPDGSFGQVA